MPPKKTSQFVDLPSFQRLWQSLPPARLERNFWTGVTAFCEPFLEEGCPFLSQEFFALPRTGRPLQKDEIRYVDTNIVDSCNEKRVIFDAFSLWNPYALAAMLKIPINVVVEQLLLATEFNWMKIVFVVSCISCAHDIKHFSSVSEISFSGTYHSPNVFVCPMCTDRTEVNTLNDVYVFFQLKDLPPVYQRRHHRLFSTEEAKKHLLESTFCPAGASYAFTAMLPRGRYVLNAPSSDVLVYLDVEVGCSAFGERDHFLPCLVDIKKYVVSKENQKTSAPSNAGTPTARTARAKSIMGRRRTLQTARRFSVNNTMDRVSPSLLQDIGDMALAEPEVMPIQSIALKQGKVMFRILNETDSSGFLDLYAAFDTRSEFSAVQYPMQLTIPAFMHCVPRGLRGPQMKLCIPKPPSTTLTKGVYVRHYFDMRAYEYDDPQVIAVLREVHRYSLEDHQGLLLGVSHGGTAFECSFLTVTAALASSICFFQRVLVRLGESIAMCLRCSITEGPLKLAAYQGQYNDADNTRSAYPDIQFVGPAIGVSSNPRILAPALRAYEEEAPRKEESAKRVTLNFTLEDEEDDRTRLEEHIKTLQQLTMIRFEMRSVGRDEYGEPDPRGGAIPLRSAYNKESDEVLPYFLTYLCEQLTGSRLEEERHASVLLVPLSIMHASVQLPTLLDRSTYTKELVGPF